jgi:nucleotide-binding universal stress UspA family protein
MFEHIVVAVDGSPQSSKTVPFGVDLARKYYEGSDVDFGPPITAEDLVETVVATFRDAGVEANGEIRRVSPGNTPEQIIEVANASHADLIVMGTRGMTEWKSLLLGGVANKVLHHATCPVLLVR